MARKAQEKRAFIIKKKCYKFWVDLTLNELIEVGWEKLCCCKGRQLNGNKFPHQYLDPGRREELGVDSKANTRVDKKPSQETAPGGSEWRLGPGPIYKTDTPVGSSWTPTSKQGPPDLDFSLLSVGS